MLVGSHIRHATVIVIMVALSAILLSACGDSDNDDNGVAEDSTDDISAPVDVETESPEAASGDDPTVEPEPTENESEPADAGQPFTHLNLELELLTEGLISPTDMVPVPDGTDRLFATSRIGSIHVIENGELREEPLLDIRERVEHHMVEQGLLSIALHPDFAENGYLYVYYITHGDEDTMISRFEMSEDGQHALPESETPILEVEQPHYSHNGGNLKFGPDGYLYIALGDGENPGDPHGHSQNPGTLLGSILRIDVDGGTPYTIPDDNPFIDDPDARDEVWAYGLRNPWRFSFDPATGDMFMVDVGQWDVEEVNVQPADSSGGENYGWPIMEGDQCWEAEECDTEGLTMPVATYPNPDMGCAIIGGYRYRGETQPELDGIYFFADWCSGNIWGMVEVDGEWQTEVLIESDLMINAFGTDHDGEIYVLNFEEGGGVFQIVSTQ